VLGSWRLYNRPAKMVPPRGRVNADVW